MPQFTNISIMRITNHSKLPFPQEIEFEAEQLLERITIGDPRPMWNYRISGKEWENYLNREFCEETHIVQSGMFKDGRFCVVSAPSPPEKLEMIY